MLRCLNARPPARSTARPPAPCRSSVSGASHLHLQSRSTGRKKREFLSFIRRFPRSLADSLPFPLPPLLFLYMYIYFCRVEEEKIFLTCKLDALLGSARATERKRQRARERERARESVTGHTNFQPTQFFALISFLFLRLPRDTAAGGGNKNFFFRFSNDSSLLLLYLLYPPHLASRSSDDRLHPLGSASVRVRRSVFSVFLI